MTTYSVYLPLDSISTLPTAVVQDISSSDTISITPDTSYGTSGTWVTYSISGGTLSPTTGSGTTTFTPTSGATSYSIILRTRDAEFAVWYYGRLTGAIGTAADTTPDAFTFTDQTGVALNSTITSNTITVSGITAAASISITGGTYSINGGAYTSSAGTVTNGQTVSVRHTSSSSYSTATNTTLTIGGVSDTFTSTTTTAAPDTTPDAFTFTDQTGVALNSLITSNTITVSGINTSTSISITGGTYSINGGAFTSGSGTVTNGQTVTVQHTSSSSYTTATNTTLTIGGVSDTFTSTTQAFVSDTTPDAFYFTDQTGVALSTVITSNTITVAGINSATSISITGGTYSINGGAYTSSSGTITNGQTVSVRHTSSSANGTITNTTLTIGGVSDTFSSTTVATADINPDPFYFVDATSVSLNTSYSDNTTITGLEPNYPITVYASGGTVDAATALGGFSGIYSSSKTVMTSSTGTILVSATVVSASTTNTTTTCTITIGNQSGTFSATTYATGTRADQFYFTDVINAALNTTYTSNSITISGLSSGTTATLTLSGGLYSKNGGAFTNTSVSVTNGDTIRLQVTSPSIYNSSNSSTLYILGSGGYTIETFYAKTPAFLHLMTPMFISMYEGKNFKVTAESTQVVNGTLYWTIDGGTTADFSSVSGSISMVNGVGTFTITTIADGLTEGSETYTLSLRTGSTAGTVVATSTLIVSDPPASSSYGFQVFDTEGNAVLDTSTYVVKDRKYTVEVSSATSISVPIINANTIAQVTPLSGDDTTNTIESVTIDYVNKLLITTGSSFLASISLSDYR